MHFWMCINRRRIQVTFLLKTTMRNQGSTAPDPVIQTTIRNLAVSCNGAVNVENFGTQNNVNLLILWGEHNINGVFLLF